jgi:ribosome maturation factor RimP
MDITAAIHEKLSSLLPESQFVVEVALKFKNPHVQKLLVVLDGDQGVSIDDCAEVSRKLSDWLDTAPGFAGPFTLEVTSPGLDQPLKLERQYRKNIGRTVKVHTRQQVFSGRLAGVQPGAITLETASKENKKAAPVPVLIPLSDIEKTLVVVSFK